ncbi:hydrogenase small subunit [Rhodobium orientis]|uniref:hydrogenase (acceptor) n=1 Tax=Rhodobium orientis TaxID=34017 RepID=A0A327JWY2_9HYPH|nr:hydrogenase small subunit [Rhodobium orientis]MBB4301243.1 hydrogenase small subunit [Rhodobium orientis]MBK5951165.1 Ni/Fe hydrogenase [Rhodobium orientis]RAI29993.1 Ni/Fe hydrogenase [Rhodobium orientis]
MSDGRTLGQLLAQRGVSRRAFLKYSSYLASLMALPPAASRAMAEGLAKAPRQSVIWLSFQECTGCTESITRAHSPTLEDLIFDFISLDYHHTLQAASGEAAEAARHEAMAANKGKYIVVVDGSVPVGAGAIYSTIAGITNQQMLEETVKDAFAVVAVGTCAAFGGIPHARPNPTNAMPIRRLVKDKPVINISGCPPIPEAMAGTLAHVLAFGNVPELDSHGRPLAFFGDSIHDRCYRRPFYDKGQFAESFDDDGARKGWCLYKLGCKGPVTYNACATLKWNGGVSFPIQSGHGCLGCSEPHFWDMGGFYKPVSAPSDEVGPLAAIAVAGGAAAGVAAGLVHRAAKVKAKAAHTTVTVDDLEKTS